MSEPWLDDRWLSLSWDLVVNVDQLVAVARAETGVDVFLTGSVMGTPVRVAQQPQAEKIWQEFSEKDPVESHWISHGRRLALNLRHLAAVERQGPDVLIHMNSTAAAHDGRFRLKCGPDTDEFFRMISQGGNKTIL